MKKKQKLMKKEGKTMLMQEEREQIVEYGKKMSADRLTSGTSGNISIYNAEKVTWLSALQESDTSM